VGISVRQTKTSQRVLTEDGATEDDLRDGLFDTNSVNAGSAKNSFKRLSKGKTKNSPDTKSAVTKVRSTSKNDSSSDSDTTGSDSDGRYANIPVTTATKDGNAIKAKRLTKAPVVPGQNVLGQNVLGQMSADTVPGQMSADKITKTKNVQGPKVRTTKTITLGPVLKGKITKAYDPAATVKRKTLRASSTSSSTSKTDSGDSAQQMFRKLTMAETVYNMYDQSQLPSNFYNRSRTVKTDLYRTYVLDKLRLIILMATNSL
jgi:plasmid maintenance system killer protein